MPNMWGDPHPWEVAGLAHQEWLAVLRYTIKRWTRSANAIHSLLEHGGAMSLEQWRSMKREHDAAYEEHWAVLRGDVETCSRISSELDKATRSP